MCIRDRRGASRNYEIALSSNTRIADWLSLSTNSRLSLSRGSTFAGLPSARFQIPSTNPFSPFANTVTIAVNDPARPLQNRNRFDGGSASATLNADLGDWRSSLSARYDLRNGAFESTSVGPFTSNSLVLGQDTNPFTGDLGLLIPLTTREANSRTSIVKVDYDSDGPIVNLWAGPLLGRFGLGANWLGFDAQDTSEPRVFNRHEYEARTGFTLPLTSASPESLFLAPMGSSELAADIGLVDLGQYGTLERHSFAFNWQLRPWIRFVAYQNRDETALSPELFSSPVIVAPNVPYFDPLNGQTVDVSLIAGGAGGLTNQVVRTRKLSLSASPLTKYRALINADYTVTDIANQIGALPPPSSAVVQAFPERFVRDGDGTLIVVDSRSVNFERQHTRQLRLGGGFTVPLREAVVLQAAARKQGEPSSPRQRIPALSLQLNASHTFVLESTTRVRAGLPVIDLLDGGAIGIGGGQGRNSSDLSLALTQGRTGIRFNMRRRGESLLIIGTETSPDLLSFSPVTTADLRLFADIGQHMPQKKWAKNFRLTMDVKNLLNSRQSVTNLAGSTPQAYQPIFRDAVGRTVAFEIRKVF